MVRGNSKWIDVSISKLNPFWFEVKPFDIRIALMRSRKSRKFRLFGITHLYVMLKLAKFPRLHDPLRNSKYTFRFRNELFLNFGTVRIPQIWRYFEFRSFPFESSKLFPIIEG